MVANDIGALMRLYATDSILKPTLSPIIRRTKADIRAYFEGGTKFDDPGFLNNKFSRILFKNNVPLVKEKFAIDVANILLKM